MKDYEKAEELKRHLADFKAIKHHRSREEIAELLAKDERDCDGDDHFMLGLIHEAGLNHKGVVDRSRAREYYTKAAVVGYLEEDEDG